MKPTNFPKNKERKRKESTKRAEKRAKKTPQQQLDIIKSRDGASLKETIRLENLMDECIRLRAENSKLRNKLGEYK